MNVAMKRTLCRLLAVSIFLLPVQGVQAGVIGTDRIAAPAASVQADRSMVMGVLSRSTVAAELHSMGVDPQAAMERAAAMTDDEARDLAGKLNALPAGASEGVLILLIVVVLIIWYFSTRGMK